MVAFKSMFPEVAEVIMPPALTGRQRLPSTPFATLRRQQLSDICVAFGLSVDRDAVKEDLLDVMRGAEQQGVFKRPPKDPYRLAKASMSADEWRAFRDGGGQMPAFEMPDDERDDAQSIQMLRQRCKVLGINTFQKTKAEIVAALAEVEGKSPEA